MVGQPFAGWRLQANNAFQYQKNGATPFLGKPHPGIL